MGSRETTSISAHEEFVRSGKQKVQADAVLAYLKTRGPCDAMAYWSQVGQESIVPTQIRAVFTYLYKMGMITKIGYVHSRFTNRPVTVWAWVSDKPKAVRVVYKVCPTCNHRKKTYAQGDQV